MSRLGRLLVATAAVGLSVGLAAPSNAASRGHIVQIQQSGSTLRVVFAANGLANGETIDPASVRLSLNGTPVPATAEPVATGGAPLVQRTAVLVIDTSGSMAGAGISGAKSAAEQFLSRLPGDVKVGLVAVTDKAEIVSPPTADRQHLRAAISHLQAHGETALYDGVVAAERMLGSSGARNLIVLSDGADTTSRTSLPAVTRLVKRSKATVEAVAFRTSDAESAGLSRLTAAGGGRVIRASATAALAQAFQQAARDIAGQIVVSAKLPASTPAGATTISVQASAGQTLLQDEAFASLTAIAAPKPADTGPRPVRIHAPGSRLMLYLGLGGLFLGAAVLLGVAFATATGSSAQSSFRRRLSIYTLTGRNARKQQIPTMLGNSEIAQGAVNFAGRVVQNRGFEEFLGQRLEAAGTPLKPSEWLLLHVGAVILVPPVLLLITGGNVLFGLIGAVAGAAGPWAYLIVKTSRRQAAFLAALPDALQLIAGGLQAGFSFPQALDTVVRESDSVIATEFNRALVDARLGVPIEDALEGIADRTKSVDFRWVVMAIRIQREVGGNLAEVLLNVAATLRERERLRRQVKVLSAEGRLSAWILGALPVLFALYLSLVRRDYIKVLVTDPIGIAMLVVLALSMTVGAVWLRKIVQVEV